MKADAFNLADEIQFEPDKGLVTFRGTRLVIFAAEAMGLLRQELISILGWDQARTFFLRFGYKNGYEDFLQMKAGSNFESDEELLRSGPVIHSWEGIVQATPSSLKYDRDTRQFHFTGVWKNSYEAEQHLAHQHLFFDGIADGPVCWTLMGYASGWSTAFFGSPLVAIEPKCMGMGDDHCEWEIKPPEDWDCRATPYIEALSDFWNAEDGETESSS